MADIERKIDQILGDLDGMTVEEAIKFFQDIKDTQGDKYTKIKLDVGWSDDSYLNLVGYRKETEQEEMARINHEIQRKAQREELERKQYEQLKAKFEGK